jgi:hypothetical protein
VTDAPEHLDPADLAVDLVCLLEGAGMRCAIGGSLALGAWGVVRGTKDADVKVFVSADRYSELQGLLEASGYSPDPESRTWSPEDRARFLAQCRREGPGGDAAVVYRQVVRVDLFVPDIPFYSEAERTRQEVVLGGKRVHFLSAEAIAVFKMLFFRDKDLTDLRRLIAVHGSLDRSYVRAQLVDMVGEDDDRIRSWEEMVREFGQAPS